MKYLATLAALLITTFCFGQTVFKVDHFSKDYYGKIFISDTSEVFSKGWVAIYNAQTHKQLIKVDAEELALSLHDGEAKANIKSLPYGEQSLIMYEDYNFDGKKDFAICDGRNSCYHGPSFRIYLATGQGFRLNEAFTTLAQENCGMFSFNAKEKKIYTMTKSGCCWHQYSEYIVVDNTPVEINIITEEAQPPFYNSTIDKWNGKRMVTSTSKSLDLKDETVDVVLHFKVPHNARQVVLFSLTDHMLHYAVLKNKDEIEFSYPLEAGEQNPDFTFEIKPGNMAVVFKNKTATYRVYEQAGKTGVITKAGGKTYHWQGDTKTQKGSLKKLTKVKLDNVY
ncbi:XAC2610-related protein [Niabella sp. 22666]|uniref:XAC2610-related protein n=1 Tax=Niabella sp. 22666 TaxID=3453954 RepID=UPI003F875E58